MFYELRTAGKNGCEQDKSLKSHGDQILVERQTRNKPAKELEA